MSLNNLSFDKMSQEKPTLDELCENVRIGGKWYQLGIQLKLDAKELDYIDEQSRDNSYKTTKMFQLLLTTNPQITRQDILRGLRRRVVNENNIANEYERTLKKSCGSATTGE